MTLQQLRYIITVSESGSLNKAAEILYISQPSITTAIKEVEREIGINIFNRGGKRGGKGVTLTNDGIEFLTYARSVYGQYQNLMQKYGKIPNHRENFSVSTQHYSFAVKAFVEIVKAYDSNKYEFAIRETKTHDVINDVSTLKSEIGILYLNNFNKSALLKIFTSNDLIFHKLVNCSAYVYLWKNHPLGKCKILSEEDLSIYPCLSFEQGENSSFYYSEELLSTNEYSHIIKACDRATMLNLMVGLNGYTLCSGIICEELNGNDYIAIPFKTKENNLDTKMEIGYITKKNSILSKIGKTYIDALNQYLQNIESYK